LNISTLELAQIVSAKRISRQSTDNIRTVVCDTRRIVRSTNAVFFALQGTHSDGHKFIQDAYQKGVRTFVVSQPIQEDHLSDATFIYVDEVMEALFLLVAYCRNLLTGRVVLIAGKIGKTSVKEWLYTLLSPELSVSRSPKSYNSNLGILLSVLEANVHAQVILIEVKPHADLDPQKINALLRPEIGILTSIEGSDLPNAYFQQLFEGCSDIYHAPTLTDISFAPTQLHCVLPLTQYDTFDNSKRINVAFAQAVALHLGIDPHVLQQKIPNLPDLALRMETFEGKNDNFLIYDLYNLDIATFQNSLAFQKSIAQERSRAVVINKSATGNLLTDELQQLIAEFQPDHLFVVDQSTPENSLSHLKNTVVLIKGSPSQQLKRMTDQLKKKRHQTEVRIDLKALRKNIAVHRELLPRTTKLMAMLKATGYGSGIDKIARFIDGFGVDYFGVAFADEGVAIRNSGITTPIMVMNTYAASLQTCIECQLEPSIFDFQQLDEFIAECIHQKIEMYPIHIKVNTGMNRLGFDPDQIDQLLEIIHAQPEVTIKSVYSHLAEAENMDNQQFTLQQIDSFKRCIEKIRQSINTTFETHILNTSGIENFPNTDFSMVRLGIGMFGVASYPVIQAKLTPVVSWYSVVGQLRRVCAGQTIGYGRSYTCKRDMIIAIVPVGYADGLPRMLSNGVGYVFINGAKCAIVGNICMDMMMVDASDARAKRGDEVEIIGINCSLQQMADLQQTIPYEVMTSISERVHKIYVE